MTRQGKFVIIIILLLVSALYAGCGGTAVPKVDKKSGIVLRQDTLVNAVVTFYSLLHAESFGQAHTLLTPQSAKTVTMEDLATAQKSSHVEKARLIKVEPGPVDDNLAVAALLRGNRFAGVEGEVALFGIDLLRREGEKWFLSRNMEEFSREEFRRLLEMLIPFEENLLASGEFWGGLTAEQAESAKRQLTAFLDLHRLALDELALPESGGEESPQGPGNDK